MNLEVIGIEYYIFFWKNRRKGRITVRGAVSYLIGNSYVSILAKGNKSEEETTSTSFFRYEYDSGYYEMDSYVVRKEKTQFIY